MRKVQLFFNAGTLAGLLMMFAGAWIVFGLGAAVLAVGWLVWCTTLIAAHFAIALRRAAAAGGEG